jgi:hypothetical protein
VLECIAGERGFVVTRSPASEHCVAPDPLDERGPDGVSERWKRQFIPAEVRALADGILADRYPKLDDAWRPVVEWARLAPELASVSYGANWLRLNYQLGPIASTLMLGLEQVAAARVPFWKDKIEHALLRLRLGRAQYVVDPTSIQELDARERSRRAELEQGDP